MSQSSLLRWFTLALRLLPLFFLAAIVLLFGTLSDRFLTPDNLAAILVQASWLMVVALGANFVLMASGVDLSVGAIMYLVIAAVALALPGLPVALWPMAVLILGGAAGALNGAIIVYGRIPAFVATLALAFALRGIGLFLSDTQMVFASEEIAAFGRSNIGGISGPLLLALCAVSLSWFVMRHTPLGLYIRAVGADLRGARRAGIPTTRTLLFVYILSGALAGVGGFLSFSQTSAATAAFGVNAEFLAIAAAVLGGTSMFGGRGSIWAPVMGAVLIMTVQNGLIMVDANPYAYPVVAGGIIFLAALLDSLRAGLITRMERRTILPRRHEDVPPPQPREPTR